MSGLTTFFNRMVIAGLALLGATALSCTTPGKGGSSRQNTEESLDFYPIKGSLHDPDRVDWFQGFDIPPSDLIERLLPEIDILFIGSTHYWVNDTQSNNPDIKVMHINGDADRASLSQQEQLAKHIYERHQNADQHAKTILENKEDTEKLVVCHGLIYGAIGYSKIDQALEDSNLRTLKIDIYTSQDDFKKTCMALHELYKYINHHYPENTVTMEDLLPDLVYFMDEKKQDVHFTRVTPHFVKEIVKTFETKQTLQPDQP